MSFEWNSFVDLADYLISDEIKDINEAHIRTSISRSYYGVYGVASDYAQEKGCKLPDKNQHAYVRDRYKLSNVPQVLKIGNRLGILFSDRKKADYIKTLILRRKDAKRVLSQAKATLRYLEDLKNIKFEFG